MKLRTSFRVITIFSLTAILLGAIGFISIQARRANLNDAISPKPTAAQPTASRAKIKEANAFEERAAQTLNEASGFNLYKNSMAFEPMFFAPSIMATKSAMLANDVNSNTFVNPGDKLMYSILVSNIAAPGAGNDATGLAFTDTLGPNLMLEAGSVSASPIAANDSYTATGNIAINVPAGSGVLVNDYLGLNPTATITAFTATSVNGGTVVLSGDGSFSYTPPGNFTGIDTFTYTLMNTTGSDTGTVTVTVSDRIMFVSSAGAGTNCRPATPCTLATADGVPTIGSGRDLVFVLSGTYNGAEFSLNPSQTIAGQAISIAQALIDAGITLAPNSQTLTFNASTTPVLNHNGSNKTIIALSTNTLVENLTLTPSGASNSTGIGGNAITTGTTTVRNITVTATSAGVGVNLTSNTGGTFNFSNIGITTTTGTGFSATGGGTVNATQDNSTTVNTISTGTGTALNVQSTTIGASGLTFRSISANGGSNGIVLNTTGASGGLTVTGNGGTCTNANTSGCSGGTIQNMAGADNSGTTPVGTGIVLTSTQNVSLTRMYIHDQSNYGIRGNSVTNMTLSTSVLNGNNGTSASSAFREGALSIVNLLGSCSFNNSYLDGGSMHTMYIENTGGTLNRLTVDTCTVASTRAGSDDAFQFRPSAGTPTMNVTVQNCTFPSSQTDNFQVPGDAGGSLDVVVTSSTFSNSVPGRPTGNANFIMNVGVPGTPLTATYNIDGNSFRDSNGANIFLLNNHATTMTGKVNNNQVGVAAGAIKEFVGITAAARGNNATHTTQITNNTIRNYDGSGITVEASQGTGQNMNATVTGNTTLSPLANAGQGIYIQLGGGSSPSGNVCLSMTGNNFSAGMPAGGIADIVTDVFATYSLRLPGFAGPFNAAGTDTFLIANNSTGGPTSSTSIFAGASVTGGAACTLPPLAPPIEADEVPLKSSEDNQAQLKATGGSPSMFARMRKWLAPAFAAFFAPTNTFSTINKVDWIESPVSAAENPVHRVETTKATANSLATAATMNGETVNVTVGTLPAGKTVTIKFNATIDASFTGTAVTNQATISGGNFSNVLSNNLSTPVIQAPAFSKAFSPTTIATNTGVSALTFTLTNPNPSQSLSGVAFSDTLPTGVIINTPNGLVSTCGGAPTATAGTGTISISGGTIAAGGNCTLKVDVKATTEGAKNNLSGNVTATETNQGGTASATLNVINAPTFSKAFGASTVQLNGATSLTFTITNNSATSALSGVAFTDTLPAGLVVATPNNLSTTCSGTATATAGSGSVSLTGASLATSGSCTLTVNVTGTTTGAKNNTATLATTELGANSASTGTVTLTVLGPPTIAKAFSPTSISAGGSSVVTLTLTNPNASNLTGAAFSDTLTNMTALGGAVTGTCSGTTPSSLSAGATSLNFSGITIPASSSCTVIFSVTSSTPGSHPNATSGVTTTQTPTVGTPSNTVNLSVFAPPTITKAFSPTSVAVGGTSTLTLTITNPAGNPAGVTGVAVSDTFPAGLEVHTTPGATNTCGGTFTAAAMATSISLTGGAIASAGGSCSVSVTVKATTGGAKLNTTGTVSSTQGGTGLTASATLSVAAAPTVAKSFSPSTVALNAPSTLTIQFTNSNAFPLTSTAITDSFPAGMEVDTTPMATNTCGGTFNPLATFTALNFSGGTIPANGSCAISVKVKSSIAGVRPNTTGTVSTAESGTGGTGTANLTVIAPPVFTKAFTPSSIVLGATSTLNFTITNNNTTSALNGIGFTDVLPAGLSVSDATTNNVCGAGSVLTVVAATRTVTLTGGNLAIGSPAATTCTIPVTVTGIAAGAHLNTTQAITSTEGGTGSTATATLNVFAPPTIAKSFSPTGVQVGGTSTLTITITNPVANPAGVTGVAVSDTFPAGMEVHTTPGATNTCGGTFTAAAMATSISLTGGAIATAGGSCSISVVVKGTTGGAKLNTTGNVSSTQGGAGGTASATLTVAAAPTVAKSFSPTSIPVNGTSTLTISFTNPNAFTLTGLAITDSFPAGLEVAATPGATNTCGGTFAPTAGNTAISLSGGSLTSSGACSISVAVRGTTAGAKLNTTGNVSSTESGNGLTANATINVFAPPTVSKVFVPTGVPLNGQSTLSIVITNPAGNPGGLTGIAISDTFPAGLEVSNPLVSSNSCGGTFAPTIGATSIGLTGGAIATAGNSCTISVNVRGTTAGAKANTTGAVSSTEGGTGLTASATLNVFAPPTITKAFSPTTVAPNGTSTLTITITNPAANPAGVTGVAVSDTFPAGMEVHTTPAATNTCGGTFSPVAAATNISLTGGAIATAGGSCSISVTVRGTTAGVKNNVTGTVSSTEGGTGLTASATLTVAAAPTVAKNFSPTSIVLNGTSTLTINFTNSNAFALTGLAITDSFPAGLEVAAVPAATNTCGGTFNPLAAATAISLSGGSLTSSGTCSISVAVKGTTAGAKNNVTGNVSTTESGAGGTANATLNVFAPPTITKAFSPTTVALNGTSTLTLTITNPAANPAGVNGVVVSDVFPAGLVVHTTPGAANTCGGTFAPTAGATNIALTGGAIATAGGSCSVSVTVRGTTPGAKLNTTGAVSSTEGGAGLTASATLNVFAPPTVTKAFSPNSIQLNNTSTLTITITNPATNSGGVTGVAINDPFPAGLEVDAVPMATNTCGGTFTANAAATSISLTGGAIATAGGSCSISVKVKGTTQGLKTNTTGAVSSTEGGAGLTATATLDVITCNSITCPTPIFTATTGNSAVVNYPAPTPDGICGTITCSPASGSTFNVGTTTVTCNSSIGNQSCSFNVTVNRVGGTATDPLACTGPGNTVQATLVITNNGNVNQTIADTTTFTNLVGVPNTCTASPNVGACVVTNGNLTYNGTLTPGQTVTLTYLTQVNDLALAGQQICTNNSVAFNSGTPFTFSVCGTVNCPAPGPGLPFPARSEASDQSAGSVLIYNTYTSSPSAPNTQNTKVSLTNTHPTLPSTVHLFFVDGASCSVADSYVCLTANQTSSFLMSDIDPGTTGYIVAVATDSKGCPINFNYLIGDEYVKFQSGHAANLGAQAFSAIPGGLVACDQNSVTATINFDGVSYDRTPRTLALDSIGAKADGNDTLLILNRIGGNLGIGASTLNAIFGIFYDDSENSVSFSVAGACQLRSSISNNFPRTTPRFEQFIPAGRTGWMKLFSQSDIGITGSAINFNPNSNSSAGAFNQGHNLHVLTLSGAASYVIPIFPPSC